MVQESQNNDFSCKLIYRKQSNYKFGASENNLQIDIDKNRDELFNNYYFENNSENMIHYQIKNFCFLKI